MCGSQGDEAAGCDDNYGKTTAEMQTASTFLEQAGTSWTRQLLARKISGGFWKGRTIQDFGGSPLPIDY